MFLNDSPALWLSCYKSSIKSSMLLAWRQFCSLRNKSVSTHLMSQLIYFQVSFFPLGFLSQTAQQSCYISKPPQLVMRGLLFPLRLRWLTLGFLFKWVRHEWNGEMRIVVLCRMSALIGKQASSFNWLFWCSCLTSHWHKNRGDRPCLYVLLEKWKEGLQEYISILFSVVKI